MPLLTQPCDSFRPDEPGSANHHDLHVTSFERRGRPAFPDNPVRACLQDEMRREDCDIAIQIFWIGVMNGPIFIGPAGWQIGIADE
jgi:hypothetical protein